MGLFDRKKKQTAETSPEVNEQAATEAIQKIAEGMVDVQDIIAPSAIEVDFNHILVGTKYFRTYFASGFPRFVNANWLSPIINFEKPIDISTFYYPVDSALIMKRLERKIGELQATVDIAINEGKPPDPKIKVALQDALDLQNQIASGTERFFHYGLYLTIRADNLEELDRIGKNVESTLGAIGVVLKVATLQQEQGIQSTIPTGLDKIHFTRNMDTTSIATTFPFVSNELTMTEGILYGINKHNRTLIIFDRFQLANANMVVFATSGAGKSYMIKLEAVRSRMFGNDVIIIDPEKEYEKLANSIGGEYISFSQDGASKINPFELSGVFSETEDELRYKILSLHGLIRLMVGGTLTPTEDAILDRALVLSYSDRGITPDPTTHSKKPPLLEDLYKILMAMGDQSAASIGARLEKYLQGSAAGIFNQHSNVSLTNPFTVFTVRDLSDELRPIAMYMMLEYIWTRIKKDKKKRLLIIDEAWWMMQYDDAAKFLFSLAKRARKYGLGLTTITQDVEDFLSHDYGKAIVSNSALQVLLKQNPASVDKLKEVFYLTEGEKRYILSAGIGEGIFFAGSEHVALRVIASKNEHKLITTNINETLAEEQDAQTLIASTEPTIPVSSPSPVPPQPAPGQIADAQSPAPPAGGDSFVGHETIQPQLDTPQPGAIPPTELPDPGLEQSPLQQVGSNGTIGSDT